jgi:general L-amino acid transport system permease protein
MRRRSGDGGAGAPPPVAALNNPKIRSAIYQIGLLAVLLWVFAEFAFNAKANLDARGIASGFGFLDHTAGFGINFTLVPYSETDTYGRVFLIGLLNTLLVAAIGIVLATVLGFLVGIARLSTNWLLARLAGGYVELIRNLPLLFQIMFWYLAVLGTLPSPRQSLALFDSVFLNNRGLTVPTLHMGPGAIAVAAALALGLAATIALRHWAGRRLEQTGREFPLGLVATALVIGPPLAAILVAGMPVAF